MFWKASTLIAIAALVGVRANPQDPPPLKVAVIRMSDFNSTAKCTAAGALLDKYKALAEQIKEKAGAMQKDLAAKQGVVDGLPPGSRGQIEALEKYDNARSAFDNYGKSSNRQGRWLMAEGRAAIFKEVQKHAAAVAAEDGYTLVLKLDEFPMDETSLEEIAGGIALTSVIWADKGLDITDKVLEKYNKEFKP